MKRKHDIPLKNIALQNQKYQFGYGFLKVAPIAISKQHSSLVYASFFLCPWEDLKSVPFWATISTLMLEIEWLVWKCVTLQLKESGMPDI